jgi:hypothetical protein
MVMDPDLHRAEIILKVRAVAGLARHTAGKNSLLGHEPLVMPHVYVEELRISLCLPLDCFRNSTAGIYAEPLEIPGQGPERTSFGTVAFPECIDHLVICMGIGQVQVKRRIIVIVPAFHAAIPAPEVYAMTVG